MGFTDNTAAGFENEEDTLSDLALLQQQKLQAPSTTECLPRPTQVVASSMALPVTMPVTMPTVSVVSQAIFDPSSFANFTNTIPTLLMSTSLLMPTPAPQPISMSSPSSGSESWDEPSYGYGVYLVCF